MVIVSLMKMKNGMVMKMRVKDLIEKLQEFRPDANFYVGEHEDEPAMGVVGFDIFVDKVGNIKLEVGLDCIGDIF